MSTDLAAHLAATAELVEVRIQDGDEVRTPRAVDHFLTVPKRRASALCADLERSGFTVRTRGGLFRAHVECERVDAVDAQSAEAFTREIVALADRHGAVYDGWGAMSVGGDEEWQDPEDGVDLAGVQLAEETTRLREHYAVRLTDDGCPPDLARRLARNVTLEVSDATWVVSDEVSRSEIVAPYSPSAARAEIEDFADGLLEDNRRRRRPQWRPRD